MLVEPKQVGKNAYLIGSKPEALKLDIMNFKEEVLVEFKELNKRLEEKYKKTDKELNEKTEFFNTQISQFNLKLSELSSKLVIDTNIKQKIDDLLNFKEKAESIMNYNKVKITTFVEEAENRMNQIDDLLRISYIFTGLIGHNCKYKNFGEFIEFIHKQVSILNDYRQKNTIDLSLYKARMENLFSSMNIKIDNIPKELKYINFDNIQKSEKKILQEIYLRDEKIKDIRCDNHDNFLKINRNLKNLSEEINLLKGVKDNVYNKINKIEEDIENFNKYDERYNNIQNQIFTLKENLLNSINYLNRTGANLKIIRNYNNTSPDNMKNILENFNYKNTSSNETTQGFSKKNKNNADIDYFGISEGENNNINDSEKNNKIKNYIHVNNNIYDEENAGNIYTKEKNKRRIKTAKYIESDITRYIKGEITADEIGISTHHQQRTIQNLKNEYLEQVISKKEYQKSLTNRELEYKNKNSNTNEDNNLNLNNNKIPENRKILKTEKRKAKSLSSYGHLLNINFQDLDATFHFNKNDNAFDIKTTRNTNQKIINDKNNENNQINDKNNFAILNYLKILQPHKTLELRNKLNLKTLIRFPKYKVLSLKNFSNDLSTKTPSNNNIKINNNFIKINNDVNINYNRLSIPKLRQKILNYDFNNQNTSDKVELNSANNFNNINYENTK